MVLPHAIQRWLTDFAKGTESAVFGSMLRIRTLNEDAIRRDVVKSQSVPQGARAAFILSAAFAVLTPAMPVHPSDARVRIVTPAQSCSGGTYINTRRHVVCRPVRSDRVPAGASAKCADGTYSVSESRRGTCSHHGGVASWL